MVLSFASDIQSFILVCVQFLALDMRGAKNYLEINFWKLNQKNSLYNWLF